MPIPFKEEKIGTILFFKICISVISKVIVAFEFGLFFLGGVIPKFDLILNKSLILSNNFNSLT